MSYNWNNEKQVTCKEYMNILDSMDGIFNRPTISKLWQIHNTAYSHGYNQTDNGLKFIFEQIELLSYNVLFSASFLNRLQALLIKSMDEGRKHKLDETKTK